MMRTTIAAAALAAAGLGGCATTAMPPAAELAEEVAATERAFARTMAERDHAAFATFLAEDTVFFSGPEPLRGKRAVAAGWQRFFESPAAPFSWEPEQVQALDSGTLALSSGPVRDPDGRVIGSFTSIWRREAPGVWRIVFDKGNPACEATP